MKNTLQLLSRGFESSSHTTPEFLAFYNTFKKEFTFCLVNKGCTNIAINKGHFYVSGFFTKGEIMYYFSIPDVRSVNSDYTMLYRLVKDYSDYTGGTNRYILFTQIQDILL